MPFTSTPFSLILNWISLPLNSLHPNPLIIRNYFAPITLLFFLYKPNTRKNTYFLFIRTDEIVTAYGGCLCRKRHESRCARKVFKDAHTRVIPLRLVPFPQHLFLFCRVYFPIMPSSLFHNTITPSTHCWRDEGEILPVVEKGNFEWIFE